MGRALGLLGEAASARLRGLSHKEDGVGKKGMRKLGSIMVEARGSRFGGISTSGRSDLESPAVAGSAVGSRRQRLRAQPEYEFIKIEGRQKRKWENWKDGLTEEDF